MLKGFFDRPLMPGLVFDIADLNRVHLLPTDLGRLADFVTRDQPRRVVY